MAEIVPKNLKVYPTFAVQPSNRVDSCTGNSNWVKLKPKDQKCSSVQKIAHKKKKKQKAKKKKSTKNALHTHFVWYSHSLNQYSIKSQHLSSVSRCPGTWSKVNSNVHYGTWNSLKWNLCLLCWVLNTLHDLMCIQWRLVSHKKRSVQKK